MSIRVEIHMANAKVELARLSEKMKEASLEAMRQQAGLIRDLAKVYVRVDTGALRDSIRLERGAEDVVRVRAGGYVINPKTGKLVDYAWIVEEKYPYLQPAIDEVAPMIGEMIKAKVVEALQS
jgi:hypothetical protein